MSLLCQTQVAFVGPEARSVDTSNVVLLRYYIDKSGGNFLGNLTAPSRVTNMYCSSMKYLMTLSDTALKHQSFT